MELALIIQLLGSIALTNAAGVADLAAGGSCHLDSCTTDPPLEAVDIEAAEVAATGSRELGTFLAAEESVLLANVDSFLGAAFD
jgi:hypothetical protein